MALKRVSRFLPGQPRLMRAFPEEKVDHVDVHTDTDTDFAAVTQ